MDIQDSLALFFDGKSSKPNEVSVIFNPTELGLQFYCNDEHNIWKYTDILIEPVGQSQCTVRHQYYRSQQLHFDNELVLPFLHQQRKVIGVSSVYEHLLFSPRIVKILVALSIITLGVVTYIYWIPNLAAKSVTLIPTEIDKKVGDSYYNGLVSSTMDIDSSASVIISKMASTLPYKGEIPVKVEVVKSSEVNAFALPNGNIIVFSGLIDKMHSAPELMAVIGHEMTHVSKRHSMRMLTQNLANVMLISIIFSDVNGIVQVLIDNSDQLRSLSYSRGFEAEADKGSFILMKNARINPNGLISLFATLDSVHNSGGNKIPEFLQSHPLSKNREANARKWVTEEQYEYQNNKELNTFFNELKRILSANL